MAQGEKKFSHITVTSDEDDDFVIQAGVPAGFRSAAPDEAQAAREDEAAGEASAQGGEAGHEAGREDDAAAEADGVERADEAIADEEADGPLPDAGRSASARSGKKKDAYRETTMEDLEATPMSLTQKVIIALALLLVVVAVVYYFLFLR